MRETKKSKPESNASATTDVSKTSSSEAIALETSTISTAPKRYASSSVATSGIIDVSGAANSAQALQMTEEALILLQGQPKPKSLDLNVGHLLLTKAVLAKIGLQIKKYGFQLHAVFSKVPQTQQAALDEGFFVKEAPVKPALSSLEQLHQHLEQNDLAAEKNNEKAIQDATKQITKDLNDTSASPFSVKEASKQADVDPVFDALPAKELINTSMIQNASGTLLVKGNLRSGQVLRYPGNLVILGDAHAGSEITADGDIVIWGELLGIAHAGANGNTDSEIRAMKIEALQLRIADHIARRPDRMYYHKPQGNAALPSPEVARVHEGEIRVFKESLGMK